MTVAVDFSPREDRAAIPRRVATHETGTMLDLQASLRDASLYRRIRGLKSTAIVTLSLREAPEGDSLRESLAEWAAS